MGSQQMYAAVGSDGTRPVVWGLGESPAEAFADAERQELSDNDQAALVAHRVTQEEAAVVMAGDVSWPIVIRPR